MRRFAAVLLLASALVMPAPTIHAARGTPPARANSHELIVFEADGCVYCEVFRRDVLPLYMASESSRHAPLRFVNLTYADESGMALAGAITIAPTIVLMRNGREVDRITGYTGPDGFLKMVGSMIGKPD